MFGRSFVKDKGDYIIVTPPGPMTGQSTDPVPLDEYRNAVADHLESRQAGKKPKVIFDLSKVTYMNSTAIGILVNSHTTIKKYGGKFILTGINKGIQNIFIITKLTLIFEVADSLKEAEEKIQ
jgi:anti-anti-sigma factor